MDRAKRPEKRPRGRPAEREEVFIKAPMPLDELVGDILKAGPHPGQPKARKSRKRKGGAMVSPVVPISEMPEGYRKGVPAANLAVLEEAGCEFDRTGPRFIKDGKVVVSYRAACDASPQELKAAICRAG